MPSLFPGAKWRPIPVSPQRARRRKGRGVGFHVAVSEAPSLFGYFSTASSDSHFYVAKDGSCEQYVDADLVAYCGGDGNPSMLWVETQGGVTNAEGEPWTGAQVETLAQIAAWGHQTEGYPLELMPDSRPTSRGIGWHKLGVRPFVAPGGEVWSSAYGKICPGLAKIGQIPGVRDRAREIVGQTPAPPVQAPAPPSIPPCPGLPAFGLPAGHYYGHKNGPARSHGGYYASERPAVQAAQRRLIAKGYVPGIRDWRSGWADGLFEDETVSAVTRFQRAEMPGTQFFGQLWADDWRRLAR